MFNFIKKIYIQKYDHRIRIVLPLEPAILYNFFDDFRASDPFIFAIFNKRTGSDEYSYEILYTFFHGLMLLNDSTKTDEYIVCIKDTESSGLILKRIDTCLRKLMQLG